MEQTYSRAKEPKSKPPTLHPSAKMQTSIRFNKPLRKFCEQRCVFMCQIVFAKANRPRCKKHVKTHVLFMFNSTPFKIPLCEPCGHKVFSSSNQSAPFAFKRKKPLVLYSLSAWKNNLLYSLTSVEQTYSRAKDPVAKNKPPTVRSSAKLHNSIRFNKPLRKLCEQRCVFHVSNHLFTSKAPALQKTCKSETPRLHAKEKQRAHFAFNKRM